MDEGLVLLGYSGHAYSVIDSVISCETKILGYCDLQKNKTNPFKIKFLGKETDLSTDQTAEFFPSVGDNKLRKQLDDFIVSKNWRQTKIINPSSKISLKANIGLSTFISSGAIVNAFVKIGKGCIINSGAIIEHECLIGDFSHIAPGAILAGNVKIGSNSFIGANATIIQGITIGQNVIIGAGAVVIKDIPDNSSCVGNPAIIIKK